jgi:tRNA(Ile)-lysidine synthase
MGEMLERVRRYIEQHGMLRPGDRVIVAVSGGPDSTALLHVLYRLAPDFQVSLHVFHLDHGVRGVESAEDAVYVRRLADRLGIPSTVVTLGPDVLKRMGGSFQANARAVRYAELEALARRLNATRVALGHNRDDQAETVLMRLLRGAGRQGLSGIPPMRTAGGITYIRPLLEIPRREIESYCAEHELQPRLDASNLKAEYLRNRIRLELLPMLAREYNPAISANLAQTASVLREEEHFLDGLAHEALERCRAQGEGVALCSDRLLQEPLALARRVVRLAARMAAGGEYDLGLEAVTRVLEAARCREGSHRLHLPGGVEVQVEYGICRFTLGERGAAVPRGEWPVALSGETAIPELGLRLKAHVGGAVPPGPGLAVFDLDRLPGPLSVRFRRPGDRLWPVGMDGSKKLQDIMVDAKVPQRLRDRIPILVSGEEVLWAIGLRLDRRFLADGATRQALVLEVVQRETMAFG